VHAALLLLALRGLVTAQAPGGPAVPALEGFVADPVAAAETALRAGAVPRARLASFARARELVREGWRAFLSADLPFAEARLVAARRVLEEVLELDGALEAVADVALRLGAVRLKAGREQEAEAAFALARALDPGRELAAGEWSPGVVAAFSRAGSPARATLAVKSRGEVTIDGHAGARREVEPGEHVVVVREMEGVAARLVLVPAAGVEVELEAEPMSWPAGFAIGQDGESAARLAGLVLEYADLDELWLVASTWRAGQPALLGQRCLAARRCTAVLEVRVASVDRLPGAGRRLVEDLSRAELRGLGPTLLEDTRVREPEPPRPGGKPVATSRAWWQRPWLWIGVGGLLVAAGTTAVLLADEPAPSYEFTVPPLVP
jgi:hypothetical protein